MLDGAPVNAELADDVLMYDALGIPPGVYLFDRPVLAGDYGFARLGLGRGRGCRIPTRCCASLARRGYRLMIWSSLWACGSDAGRQRARGAGARLPRAGTRSARRTAPTSAARASSSTSPIPAAQAWWRDKVARLRRARYGIQGIKLDRGEEHIPSEATDVWADGRTGREVRNDYPTLQAKIHHDALAARTPTTTSCSFSRAGLHRHAALARSFWGGDIPGSETFGVGPGTDLGLRSAIISQQRAAFMGFPIWGSDTGGYYQFKDREVFARWIEFSAFSGIMEIGGDGTHAPWDMPTDAAYDTEMIDIYRRYTALRVTLQPYIVAAAARGRRAGMPIVRPMPFVDRTDRALARPAGTSTSSVPTCWSRRCGRSAQRSAHGLLPARARGAATGTTSRCSTGRRTVTVDVPLDTIPVFVRDGADVPKP